MTHADRRRHVILCNPLGEKTGEMEVVEAHTGKGHLHRAFSVYVFSPDKKKILIQKRSEKKMLWPGIWANTCCSHPREDETPAEAGERRMKEELGFSCPLKEGPTYVYRAEDPSGKGVEHEHVTILLGIHPLSPSPSPNPDEVSDWRWESLTHLEEEMKAHHDRFAPWFHLGLPLAVAAMA